MKKIFLTVTLAMLFAISACDSGVKELEIESDVYHETMDKLSEIIVHDIFLHLLRVESMLTQASLCMKYSPKMMLVISRWQAS